jgi:hypothetical protein
MERTQRRGPQRARTWLLSGCLLLAGLARADGPVRVGIVFHVASSAQHHAPPDDFIRLQLQHANAIYRPLGFELLDAGREAVPERHAKLVTRTDRDELLPYARAGRGVVHCVVVATLMDVDEPGRERRGVHWRARRDARHLVILSTLAGPYVLSHELGHFFGNREHSQTAGNLMSYLWTDAQPFLDEGQQVKVKLTLQKMLATRELRPIPESGGPRR